MTRSCRVIWPRVWQQTPPYNRVSHEAVPGWAHACLAHGDVFQNKNLDWFPRMRAMSLVSNEGEGEQNEIRILQDKLNSTMKLVSHLTTQLNELKEQVRPSLCCPDGQPQAGSGHTQPAKGEVGAVQLL